MLAWWYLFDMAGGMSGDMLNMSIPVIAAWNLTDLVLLFIMWTVMMIAMMVPSAAPMILAFVTVNQRRGSNARPVVPAYVFVLGYVATWSAYAAVATMAQWGLHTAALISPKMVVTSPLLSGGILVAAGIFQWTPLKRACLTECRSPLTFLMSEWREGTRGAFVMGLRHGSYCVGCCWMLMALLFVAGVMNLLWVAAIATFVIAEKLLPSGRLVGGLSGAALTAIGLAVIFGTW